MQMLWCWRCRMEMPMLDETEFARIQEIYRSALFGAKDFRRKQNIPLSGASIDERLAPVAALYEQITGMKETNVNAILHHRIALYGPPCRQCHKPLRTPRARLCGSCMAPVEPP